MLVNTKRACALACAGSVIFACTTADAPLEAPADTRPASAAAAADRMFYQVRLGSLGDSRSHGVMLIDVTGGYLRVRVHAAGLAPLHNIPQHIHLNPTCDPGGGILINLDATLTVPGEGPGVGPAYPTSNAGGVVNYSASRSLTDLLAAVNTHAAAGLTSVDALLAWLDLENRNGHMHVPVGPPFPAVSCGVIIRLR